MMTRARSRRHVEHGANDNDLLMKKKVDETSKNHGVNDNELILKAEVDETSESQLWTSTELKTLPFANSTVQPLKIKDICADLTSDELQLLEESADVEAGNKSDKETTQGYPEAEVMKTAKRLNFYSLQFKLKVVQFASQNSVLATCRQFNIGKSTVMYWLMRANANGRRNSDTSTTPVSMESRRYPDRFREKVVKFGESKGWKAAANKFGVAESTVGVWAKRLGKVKYINKVVYVEEVVKYGLLHNSWAAAARQFGLSNNIVSTWGSRAGYRLEPKNQVQTKFGTSSIEKVVKYGLAHNSWAAAAQHFGLSPNTVSTWGSRAGYRLQIKRKVEAKLRKSSQLEVPGKKSRARVQFETQGGYVDYNLEDTGVLKPAKKQGNASLEQTFSFPDTLAQCKCEACGAELALDETLMEHIVSIHLTCEGLCDICGESSVDFIGHFKNHLRLQALTLLNIKKDIIEDLDCQMAEPI